MASSQIIGRVAVKVTPDTSKFRSETKIALEKIEPRLPKVKIAATFDSTGLKREILNAVKRINAQIKGKDAYKIKFGAAISQVGMRGEVKEAVRQLKAIAKGEKVQVGIDAIAGTVAAELDKKSLEIVKQELEKFRRDNSPIKIDVRPQYTSSAAKLISARLAVLSRPRFVNIVPKLDKTAATRIGVTLAALSGARLLSSVLDGLWSRLKNLDKAVPIIGTVAEATAGLAAFGLSAASNLFALASSLAQIGPAALALPGIFGGIAIGLGATFVAFKDFNKVLPEVGQKFATLQSQMSARFWEKAKEPIRDLVNNLFPQFSRSIQETSTALGGFFANLAGSLDGKLGPILASMFDDLNRSIVIASGSTDAFAGIIATLGKLGAGYLPQLAGWVSKLATQFDGFLTASDKAGKLTAWVDAGIVEIKNLGRVFGNLGMVLYGIATAANAAGGSSLSVVADTLGRVADVVNGTTFQTNLTAVLTSASTAMDIIATRSGPGVSDFFLSLAGILQRVLPVMGATVGTALGAITSALAQPIVASGILTMFQGLQTAVEGLAPAMGPVAGALAALMTVVGRLASVMGPVLGVALTAVAKAVQTLAPAVLPVISLLGGGLLSVVQTLAPVVETLATAVAGLVDGALFPALAGIISSCIGPLQSLGGIIKGVIPGLAAAFGPLITAIGKIASAVLPVLIAGFGKVIVAIAPLLPYIGKLATFLGIVLPPVIAFVANLLVSALVGAINGVVSVIQGFVNIVSGVINVFKAIFTGNWSALWAAVLQIVKGVWQVIKGAFLIWLNVGILSIARKGLTLLKGVFKGGWSGIRSTLLSVWNGIKSRFVAFMNGVKSTGLAQLNRIATIFKTVWAVIKAVVVASWDRIRNTFTTGIIAAKAVVQAGLSKIRTIFSTVLAAARALVSAAWSRMREAFSNGVSRVVGKVRELPGKIVGALSGVASKMFTVGTQIVSGLINGIRAKAGAAASAAASMVRSAIRAAHNALEINSPSKVFRRMGFSVGEGFINGINGSRAEVKTTMDRLLALVKKTGRDGAIALVNRARTKLLKMGAHFDKLTEQISSAKNNLESLIQESKQYAETVAGNVINSGSAAQLEDQSLPSIIKNLKEAVARANLFSAALKKLKTLGLNQTTFDQLASAGPEAALAAVDAIANGGAAGVKSINALQGQLTKAANAAGATAKSVMFDNGIQMAEGLLKGLQDKRADLVKEMETLANALVKALKKKLGIKSPSKVFKDLGSHVGTGFALGIDGEKRNVTSSIEDMAAARPGDLSARIGSAIDPSPRGTVINKVVKYYAAPGSSLNSEEDLFAAADRARMVFLK